MKKILKYLIIFILIIILRNNISYFYGNILGIFKLDNNYYEEIIKLKDDKIKYLEEEINNINTFSTYLHNTRYNYKLSKVLYKKTYNSNKYIIDLGKKDNIKKGYAVVNEIGLVGIITKVNKNTSILTKLNKIKDLNVIVNNSYGKLNYINNNYIISDISNYDNVNINDKVYTSGYGDIKENIYIGKVSKIENNTISKKIYIDINNNLDNLNYLLIVGE